MKTIPIRIPPSDDDHERRDRPDALPEQLGDEHARQGEHAADREVEAADEQHEREPDADDQQDGVRLQDVERVRPGVELRLQQREDDDQDQQHREDADVLQRRLADA